MRSHTHASASISSAFSRLNTPVRPRRSRPERSASVRHPQHPRGDGELLRAFPRAARAVGPPALRYCAPLARPPHRSPAARSAAAASAVTRSCTSPDAPAAWARWGPAPPPLGQAVDGEKGRSPGPYTAGARTVSSSTPGGLDLARGRLALELGAAVAVSGAVCAHPPRAPVHGRAAGGVGARYASRRGRMPPRSAARATLRVPRRWRGGTRLRRAPWSARPGGTPSRRRRRPPSARPRRPASRARSRRPGRAAGRCRWWAAPARARASPVPPAARPGAAYEAGGAGDQCGSSHERRSRSTARRGNNDDGAPG